MRDYDSMSRRELIALVQQLESKTNGAPADDATQSTSAESEALVTQVQDLSRSQRELMQAVFEQVRNGILVCDHRGRVVLINSAARRLGRVPDGLVVTDCAQIDWGVPHTMDGRVVASEDLTMARALRGETVQARELHFVRDDGTTYDILVSGTPLRTHAGTIIGAVIVFADITELKAAQQKARDNDIRLRMAQRAAGIGAWEWDIEQKKVHWSEGLYRAFGVSPRRVPPTIENFLQLVHPADRPQIIRDMQTLNFPEGELRQEYRIVRPDGSTRWLESRGRVIADGGRLQRIIGVVVDVTDFKETQAKLEQAVHTLAERTAEAEDRARQLKRLAGELNSAEHRERRRLAQFLHDDLQQTLYAASIKLRMAQDQKPGPEVGRLILDAISMIDEAVCESRSLTVELSPTMLEDQGLVAAMHWLARQIATKHGLHVTIQSDANVEPKDKNTASLLFQAVRELLFNVVKHAGVDRAALSLRRSDGGVQVTVSDQGRGIDLMELSRRELRGESYGLHTLRDRLALSGLRLELESAPGQGCRATIHISPEALSGTGPLPLETCPGGSRIRVAVADDHTLVRQGLAAMLSSETGLDIIGEAADGLQAVDLAKSGQVDVLLMDVSMPCLNGIEATRRIRMEAPGVQVVGVSMLDDPGVVRMMLEAGARAVLPKDVATGPLIAAIRDAAAHVLPARAG